MTSTVDIVAAINGLFLNPTRQSSVTEAVSPGDKAVTPKSRSKRKRRYKPKPTRNETLDDKESSTTPSSKSGPPLIEIRSQTAIPVHTPPSPQIKSPEIGNGPPGTSGPSSASPTQQKGRSPRNRPQKLNANPRTPQTAPSTTASSNKQSSSSKFTQRQTTLPYEKESEDGPRRTTRYVVQASNYSSIRGGIVGVFSDLKRANECAKEHVGRWGVRKDEIQDIRTSFGNRCRAPRRSWQGGMSEIRVQSSWVRVLPKDYDGRAEDKKVYLAIDLSLGLFMIGVFAEKGQAWEACKKYSDQLAYCSEIAGKEQWFDLDGMYHLKGKIGDQVHHWFVSEYALDETEEREESG